MEVVRTKEALIKILERIKKIQTKVSFIPTMGNLHDGHLKLIEAGKRLAENTVVSIFVNKKQFSANEDFENYPRTEEADLEKLKATGVTVVYIPRNAQEVFGSHFNLNLDVKNLTNCLCGVSRPDFFSGVLAVVMKLFLDIKPDFAILGKKDYQQFLVLSALAESLEIGTEVVGIETVREESGLAMSSRNNYFSAEERAEISFINKTLIELRNALRNDAKFIDIKIFETKLLNYGISKIDYLEIRSGKDLTLLTKLTTEAKPIIFFAGWFKGVRLIDNLEV